MMLRNFLSIKYLMVILFVFSIWIILSPDDHQNLVQKSLDESKSNHWILDKIEKGEMDFSGLDLSGTDLSGLDLSNAKFFGTILQKTNLSNSNLTNADFSGANMRSTNFNST